MGLKRKDLIYPELSYEIIGILFDVYNEVGYGHKEKYYHQAIAAAFRDNDIGFKAEVYVPVHYRQLRVGQYFLDFLVENKIVVEIKQGEHFSKSNIQQVYSYLKATDLELGILVNFTRSGVKFRRVLNIKNPTNY